MMINLVIGININKLSRVYLIDACFTKFVRIWELSSVHAQLSKVRQLRNVEMSAPRFCKCHYPKTTHCMVWIGNLLRERKSQQPQTTHFWVLCEIWQVLQGLSWCLALHSFPELLVSSHVPPQNFPQTPWSSFSMLKASNATYMCTHWYAICAAWLKITKI